MFKSFSIATKIAIALCILIVGYSTSILVSYYAGNKIKARAFYVSACLYPAASHSKELLVVFDKQSSSYYDAISVGETDALDSAVEQAESADEYLKKIAALNGLRGNIRDGILKLKKRLNIYTDKATKYYKKTIMDEENSVVLSPEEQKKKIEAGNLLNDERDEIRKSLLNTTTELSKSLKEELDGVSKDTGYQQIANLSIFSIVVIISLCLALWIIRRAVSKPLKRTVFLISEIASGDLTREFHSDMRDEVGQIIEALNTMVVSLKEILHMVAETTKKTSTASLEISAAVEEQAAVTSEQSSSVSEITATMEELSITTTQVAEYSNSVAGIAIESLENTKIGAESVELVMNKMNEINVDNQKNIRDIIDLGKKSEEINKVMVIINNIADQTKLIAFNAALEASSAGEAGKRFGVVAAEIRRLADSVIVSTGETESKIKEIQDAVNNMVIASEKSSKGIRDGLEYSTDTAAKLNDIVAGAQETADAAKQISLSTQQELSATEQVLTALKEIEQGAKQAASSIGQIGFISKDLENLSRDLTGLIGKFRLKKEKK